MSMRISNNTAKRTMTEFKGLDLVTMEKVDPNKSNSEYKITLNSKFDWFLTEEFKKLRDNFKPTTTDNNDKPSKSETNCCDENTPCVPANVNNEDYSDNKKTVLSLATTESLTEIEGKKQEQQQPDDKFSPSTSESTTDTETTTNDNDVDSHRGTFRHSKIY